jgi:hypothetical protein
MTAATPFFAASYAAVLDSSSDQIVLSSWTRCRPEVFPSTSHRLQDGPPKSTSLVSTVPAVRPGAVW